MSLYGGRISAASMPDIQGGVMTSPVLSYTTIGRQNWRRRLAVGVVVLGSLLLWQSRPLWRWAAFQYAVNVHGLQTPAKSQTAIAFSPKAAGPLKRPGDYGFPKVRDFMAGAVAVYQPRFLLTPRADLERWTWGDVRSGGLASLYSGWRVSPNGDKRLVMVFGNVMSRGQGSDSTEPIVRIYALSYSQPAWNEVSLSNPHVSPMYYLDPWAKLFTPQHRGTPMNAQPRHELFTGQSDPNDRGKFTIPYTLWGEVDTIDGALLDQGIVRLEPRRGVLFEPSSSGLWLSVY